MAHTFSINDHESLESTPIKSWFIGFVRCVDIMINAFCCLFRSNVSGDLIEFSNKGWILVSKNLISLDDSY